MCWLDMTGASATLRRHAITKDNVGVGGKAKNEAFSLFMCLL